MGYKSSPYGAVHTYHHTEEFIIDNSWCLDNPFQFNKVILNPPVNDCFTPALRRVYKWYLIYGPPTVGIKIYVDDLRIAAAARELGWQVAGREISRLYYLGIYDALRKTRLGNEPYTGGIFISTDTNITKSVTETKLRKGQVIIKSYVMELREDQDKICGLKRLERTWIFLYHMGMPYK